MSLAVIDGFLLSFASHACGFLGYGLSSEGLIRWPDEGVL